MKYQVLFALFCLLAAAYAQFYGSSSGKGRGRFSSSSSSGGGSGSGMSSSGKGKSYMVFPAKISSSGKGARRISSSGSSSGKGKGFICTPGVPYKDSCGRQCLCRNNKLSCPKPSCSLTLQTCPIGGSYQKGCNTCFCIEMGTICTAKKC